jgi:hypothetical protein
LDTLWTTMILEKSIDRGTGRTVEGHNWSG